MIEASRVQKLLIDQNNEINRLRNRIEQLEAALREIHEKSHNTIDVCEIVCRVLDMEGKDD